MHKKYHCLRRVSFLFRQERYERSRPRGGAEKLLPQLQAPSPGHPSRTLFGKAQRMLRHERIKGASWEAPFSQLAAAAVVIAAAVIAASVTAQHIAAAVAEQEDQDDDPANVTAAETVIVTHKTYLQNFLSENYRSFQDIPQDSFGAQKAGIRRCRLCCFNQRVWQRQR